MIGLAVGRLTAYDPVVPDDQIHLTACCTVGAGGADLLNIVGPVVFEVVLGDQSAGGAGGGTVAAVLTFGVLPGHLKAGGNGGVEAAVGDGQNALALNLGAGALAPAAEDALLGVVGQELVGVVRLGPVGLYGVFKAGLLYAVLEAVVLKLAAAVLGAAEAVALVVAEQQIQHEAPGLDDLVGLGVYHHAVGAGLGAGGDQTLGVALHLHQTHPAGAFGIEIFEVAQGGDLHTGQICGCENGVIRSHLNLYAVNGNCNEIRIRHCSGYLLSLNFGNCAELTLFQCSCRT